MYASAAGGDVGRNRSDVRLHDVVMILFGDRRVRCSASILDQGKRSKSERQADVECSRKSRQNLPPIISYRPKIAGPRLPQGQSVRATPYNGKSKGALITWQVLKYPLGTARTLLMPNMQSPIPSYDEELSLCSSPALSFQSSNSSWAATAPPPSEHLHISSSVAVTMGVQNAPLVASTPPAPPGLIPPPPAHTPLPFMGPMVSLDLAMFLQFLNTWLDNRGMRQALIWLLDPIGCAIVHYNSIIVHRMRQGVECYGRVVKFLARSETEALFQMRILGWETGMGWCAPGGDLFSYIIVPVARCVTDFWRKRWTFFKYSTSLQPHILDIVERVRAVVDDSTAVLTPSDWLTGCILRAHLDTPAIMAFKPVIGTGLTFMVDDLDMPMRHGMVMPPASFNPHGMVSVNLLYKNMRWDSTK